MENDFNTKWGWLHGIYALAGDDITKVDAVTKLDIGTFLTKLLYNKERGQVEKNRLDNMKRKR